MNITNEIKQHLISGMIRKASKRQAASTAKAAKALDKLWRLLFAKHIQQKIPEVPQARWAPLIQEGVFNSLKGEISVITLRTGDKWKDHDSTPLGKVGKGYGNSTRERTAENAKWDQVRRAVAHEWGAFLNFTVKYTGSYDFHYTWKASHADLPSVKGLSRILHPDAPAKHLPAEDREFSEAAYKLSIEVDRLMAAYMSVLESAYAMYDDLTAILLPIRTLKQLQDQFPDAVEFLPAEFTTKVKNTKQLADPALISRARRMLAEGIPD